MAKLIAQKGATIELTQNEIVFIRHVIGNNSMNSVEAVRKNYDLTEKAYTAETWAGLHDKLYSFFNRLMTGVQDDE